MTEPPTPGARAARAPAAEPPAESTTAVFKVPPPVLAGALTLCVGLGVMIGSRIGRRVDVPGPERVVVREVPVFVPCANCGGAPSAAGNGTAPAPTYAAGAPAPAAPPVAPVAPVTPPLVAAAPPAAPTPPAAENGAQGGAVPPPAVPDITRPEVAAAIAAGTLPAPTPPVPDGPNIFG